MFGYILINKPELKVKEFDRYHAYYCGICKDLRFEYGISAQAALSFDLTFLAILLTALYEPKSKRALVSCAVHPLSKHETIRNEYTLYAASMNVLLAYEKALDDMRDEKSLKGRAMALLLKSDYGTLKEKYAKKVTVCKRALHRIHRLEKEGCTDLDLIAGSFGDIMGELFVFKKDEWERHLRRMGFYLGKFIYIYDAWDDIESDIKKNLFNPLKEIYENDKEHFDERVRNLLMMMMSACAESFEMLPLLRDAALLRNILYSGVWGKFYAKIAPKAQGV